MIGGENEKKESGRCVVTFTRIKFLLLHIYYHAALDGRLVNLAVFIRSCDYTIRLK